MRTVCHCFAANGAGACITAGTETNERHILEPKETYMSIWHIEDHDAEHPMIQLVYTHHKRMRSR
jgi:hypothetical protein